jgi:hypothetical protein
MASEVQAVGPMSGELTGTASDIISPSVLTGCDPVTHTPRAKLYAENGSDTQRDVYAELNGTPIWTTELSATGALSSTLSSGFLTGIGGYANVVFYLGVVGQGQKIVEIDFGMATEASCKDGPSEHLTSILKAECDDSGNNNVIATIVNGSWDEVDGLVYADGIEAPVLNKKIPGGGSEYAVGYGPPHGSLPANGQLRYYKGSANQANIIGEYGYKFESCSQHDSPPPTLASCHVFLAFMVRQDVAPCPALKDIVEFGFSDDKNVQPDIWYPVGVRYPTQQALRYLWLKLKPMPEYYSLKWTFDPSAPIDPTNAAEILPGGGRPKDPPLTMVLGFKQQDGSIPAWLTQPGWVVIKIVQRNAQGDCVILNLLMIKIDADDDPDLPALSRTLTNITADDLPKRTVELTESLR